MFSIIEPLIVWGGMFTYPLVVYTGYHQPIQTLTVAAVVGCTLALTTRSDRLKHLYRRWSQRSRQDMIYLNEPVVTDQPVVQLCTPHGIVCVAGLMFAMEKLAGYHTLMDNLAYSSSPFVQWVGYMSGVVPDRLTNARVVQLMRQQCNIALFAGGFVELAGNTTVTEVIYTAKIPYWIKRCAQYGYQLRLTIIYEVSRFYQQPVWGTETRLAIAAYNLPAMLAIPNIGSKPTLFVRTLDIDLDMDILAIEQCIREQYATDLQYIYIHHGVQLKQLRLISKL